MVKARLTVHDFLNVVKNQVHKLIEAFQHANNYTRIAC
jgi:hypothetical protein